MSLPLRGAIIGTGFFAEIQIEAWQRIDDARIVAVCDLDRHKAQAFAEKHGISQIYTDADSLLAEEKLDFIDIVTRPESHLALVEKGARAGVAILCQKPLAPTFTEALTMVEICEAQGVRFMANENWRWQRWYREMKGLLASGVIGKPWHAYVRVRSGDGRGAEPYKVQPYFREMPRFLIHETLVHFLDTLRFLVSDINRVQAIVRRINPIIVGEDLALLLLEFSGGETGLIDANRYSDPEEPGETFGKVVLEGEGGALVLAESGDIVVQPNGKPAYSHPYIRPGGYRGDSCYATQLHFIQTLVEGTAFETAGRDYLKTIAAVEAAYQAATSGRAMEVKVP